MNGANPARGEKLRRFIVFSYPQYYPGGGINDVSGHFDTLVEAVASCNAPELGEYQEIFDCDARMFLDAKGQP